jgi:hypothetical protein
MTLRKVKYTLYRLAEGRETKVKESAPLVGDKPAGEPFAIKVDVQGVSEGPMLLLVEGIYKNRTGGPIREYKFHHKPQVQ